MEYTEEKIGLGHGLVKIKTEAQYIVGLCKDGKTPVVDECKMWEQIFTQLSPEDKEKIRGSKPINYFE